MKTHPKITTIIPTFNRSKRLQKAIQSVLDQTYQDFRIFVCDNASTDDTKDVVRRFTEKDSRIQYYCQQNVVSVYENWQTGLDHVETSYYNFLADDDFVLPWFYEMAIAALEKEPSTAFFASGLLGANDQGKINGINRLLHEGIWKINSNCNPKNFILNGMFTVYGNVYRKVLPDGKISMKFDEKLTKYIGFAEVEYTLRLLFNYPIINTAQYCYCCRSHDSNLSENLSFSKTEYNEAMQVIEKLFEKHLEIIRILIKNGKRTWDVAMFRNSISKILKKQSIDTNLFCESHRFWVFLLQGLSTICRLSMIRRFFKLLLDLYKSRRRPSYSVLQEEYGNVVSKYTVINNDR